MSGVPAEIAEATIQSYQQQVAEMAAVIQAQQNVIWQRAEPGGTAVLDMLNRWCDLAEGPPGPQQQACLAIVQKWVAAEERMRAVAKGIVIPPRNGSGLA